MSACEHGSQYAHTQLPPGGWMGGVGFCTCCRSNYGYTDSFASWITANGIHHVRSTTFDHDRCRKCGGKSHTYETGSVVFQ